MMAITVNDLSETEDSGTLESAPKAKRQAEQNQVTELPAAVSAPSSATESAAALRAFFGAILPPI